MNKFKEKMFLFLIIHFFFLQFIDIFIIILKFNQYNMLYFFIVE